MPQAASRGHVWFLVTFGLVTAVAAPGVVYALTQGPARTRGLLICLGVELALIVGVGLYLRARGRAAA
ncbi:hypothetical protein SUDANB1_04400 [Streptomyces sp. enrichment culture]|jgi:hypothetical protein|uniref:hypothetical protein n=1 Tax=Streptomyces sp. enrichment culture TaxID=1795815 RepID=UPI003F56AB9F